VRRILTMAAFAVLAGLTACSVSAPDPDAASTGPAQPEPGTAQSAHPSSAADNGTAVPSSSAAGGAAGRGTREACELFNSLFAEYGSVPANDPNGFEDIYLRAEDAKDTVAGDLGGLFASLSLLAIDHSAAAESGGGPEQGSKDAVRDAVFANAGTCTAEGVTLRL
jgi:hypothetical protein